MLEWLVTTLKSYPEIAVFLSLGIGYYVGGFSFRGFSLGAVTSTLLADWRSTVIYGYVHSDSLLAQEGSAYDYTHYASSNLVRAPTASSKVGVEYLYGYKQEADGRSGDDSRLQFSIQYSPVK